MNIEQLKLIYGATVYCFRENMRNSQLKLKCHAHNTLDSTFHYLHNNRCLIGWWWYFNYNLLDSIRARLNSVFFLLLFLFFEAEVEIKRKFYVQAMLLPKYHFSYFSYKCVYTLIINRILCSMWNLLQNVRIGISYANWIIYCIISEFLR